ncbi:nitroreductase family deazaflavin-dependent oxidoreductase [Nocardia brasiliensis]|uniref:nitroreductase family deazaflavin-dependent oxidoreductase n=1 Tax=Nocardia brasiliensis TaxID=37326 RepID=UPI0036720896
MDDLPNDAAEPAEPDSARLREIRAAAEVEAEKHTVLVRTQRAGRLVSGAMLPWFLVHPPQGYAVLTTIGRKTGKKRRTCVRVIRRDNLAYLVQLTPPHIAMSRPGAPSGWLLNIRAHPHVRIRLPDGTFDGVGREITDPTERAIARTILCETVTPTDYGECALHLRGRPSRTKIQELHRYWFDTGNPLVIELEHRPA